MTTKVIINLKDGLIHIEGSENFVSKHTQSVSELFKLAGSHSTERANTEKATKPRTQVRAANERKSRPSDLPPNFHPVAIRASAVSVTP